MNDKTPTPNHIPPVLVPDDSLPEFDAKAAARTAEQNAQARLVLIQLQWLVTILLVSAIVWLGNNQRKLILAVDERLQATEALVTRMNNMDDRLFALTPAPKSNTANPNAQSDLQLLGVRLDAAQRLYNRGDYDAADEILKTLSWQLDNKHIAIATPLKAALTQSLQTDIEHLAAVQSQPDAWQLHVIKMRDVQSYLRALDAQGGRNLTRPDLIIHDATIMLSLAIGAGTLRERDTMTVYLQEVLGKLEALKPFDTPSLNPLPNITTTTPTPTPDTSTDAATDTSTERGVPKTLDEAIFAINSLLASSPRPKPLASMRMFRQQQREPSE